MVSILKLLNNPQNGTRAKKNPRHGNTQLYGNKNRGVIKREEV